VRYELRHSNIQFVVVDRRAASNVPPVGFYIEQPERRDVAYFIAPPIPQANLDKFSADPAFSLVYDNGNMRIYAVDQGALASPSAASP
jgi:hypothetical protein